MDNDAKLRPLYLAKILYEQTDEEHVLTTAQLIQILEERYGIKAHRQTIKAEIELVNQDNLIKYIGKVSDAHTKRLLTNASKKALGLWNYEPKDKTSIRCLCPRCLEAYKSTGKYIVHRLDPFQKVKDTCDLCQHTGWDYVVAARKFNCSEKPNS